MANVEVTLRATAGTLTATKLTTDALGKYSTTYTAPVTSETGAYITALVAKGTITAQTWILTPNKATSIFINFTGFRPATSPSGVQVTVRAHTQ